MSIQFVLLVVAILANITLGAIAILRNPNNKTNRLFTTLTILISIWMAASYFEDKVSNIALAKALLSTDLSIAPLMSLLMFEFINSFFGTKILNISIRKALIVVSISAALMPFTPLLGVNVITLTSDGIRYQETAWSNLYYLLLLIPLIASIIMVSKFGKTLRGKAKTQIRITLLGLTIWALVALIANAILPAIFGPTLLSRIGIYGSVIYIGFTAYAIIKHKLFDIKAVIARSITYILLLVSLGTIYGIVAFSAGNTFFSSSQLNGTQQIFNIGLAIVLAFTFQPLRRFFEKITDKIFYRDKYDPQALINDIGHVLATEIDLHKLSTAVLNKLSANMKVAKLDLLVLNQGTLYFEAHTTRDDRLRPHSNDLAILGSTIMVYDELEAGVQKDVLGKYDFSVSVPLISTDGFIGYLLLGEKRSGDIYNQVDTRVLQIIANELAVAIQNVKAYIEIQHFNETLKAKITAATAQLQDANAHLKEMDNVKDEFISMASHQLGTPLTVIDGYISMVTQGIYGALDQKQTVPLTEALSRVRIMKRLVADLLNISRMEAGRFFIDATPTDLNNIVPEEVEMLQGRAKEKEVSLSYIRPERPLPDVNIDEQKTRQAMMNLIDNAIFYSPKGIVKVSLESDGHNAIFKVVDNGIGVPEAQKQKLFSKFFRANNAKTERPNGTGIGLFLVKRVVEDQGGKLIFASEQGKGSTFGFSLPLTGAKSSTELNGQTPSSNLGTPPNEAINMAAAMPSKSSPSKSQTPAQSPNSNEVIHAAH